MRALILDRDGVIIKERGEYTYDLNDVSVLDDNILAIKKYLEISEVETKIFVLTNQGGIAKGIYSNKAVQKIHALIQDVFRENKMHVEAFYVCPHHEDYTLCFCRKPKNLLFQKIAAKYNIKPENCLMVGDKERDVLPAINLGMRHLLIESNASLNYNQIIF